jgi:SMODS-associating 4TM effector domain
VIGSPAEGNKIAERQRSPEAVELLRAYRRAYVTAKHWHAARLAGTVLVALAAPVVILFAPSLEHPLGAIGGGWVLAARLVLRPAQERATRFAVAVQELYDQRVLGLLPAAVPQPPAYEQIHQQACRRAGVLDPDWYSVRPDVGPAAAALIAQRSSTVWSRRLHREWAFALGSAAAGWTLLTVIIASVRGATVSEFLIAVLLPMLPALLDATDLCQAHSRAATERSGFESQLDLRLDQTAQGHPPSGEDLRALQDEINRQRLAQPPVPDWYYRLRRSSYETSMRAAADHLAQRIDAAAAASAPGT